MKWYVLWCEFCNERWPISAHERRDPDHAAHFCPSCERVGARIDHTLPLKAAS